MSGRPAGGPWSCFCEAYIGGGLTSRIFACVPRGRFLRMSRNLSKVAVRRSRNEKFRYTATATPSRFLLFTFETRAQKFNAGVLFDVF